MSHFQRVPRAIAVQHANDWARVKCALFLTGCLVLGAILSGMAWAEPLPLKQERLGAWNYLYPMELGAGNRPLSTPTTLCFGATRERLAVIVPGSTKLAEFKAGVFNNLQLPAEWTPVSLATTRGGKLFSLVQHSGRFLVGKDEWKKRWAIGLGAQGWKAPVPIPYEDCDRLEFDSQDRLWALGRNRQVGFFADGKWSTFTYSDDRQLGFLPLRLSEDASGRVVLFALAPPPGGVSETSRLIGTLSYAGGRFTREPGANTTALCAAENRRYAEPFDQPGFDRAHGYVCHTQALNVGYHGPTTALRTDRYFFVSLANDGFLWADAAGLVASPPLESDEWEPIDDVTVSPFQDAAGDLWIGRGPQLMKIGVAGMEAAQGQLQTAAGSDNTIDFDPLGRPWVMRWHGAFDGAVTICDHGILRRYPNFGTALQGESTVLAPGRIFPFALKAPSGILAAGGGYFEVFTIVDAKGPHEFTARQIFPGEKPPRVGHGYNPFRDGEPWTDAAGRICAGVAGLPFVYDPKQGRWSPAKEGAKRPPPPAESSDFAGPYRAKIEAAGHRTIVFHGFHFFLRTEAGEQPLDTGLNPLAFYPFWTGWYDSPGLTTPRVDPAGHLWISALGPYGENQHWFRLKRAAW